MPPLCDACGDPLAVDGARRVRRSSESEGGRLQPSARLVCARCRDAARAVSRARAAGAYDGALRAVIHALKYDARRSLARPLGALLRDRGGELLHGAACVVPVPLHPARQRERGFNQARDLARHLGLPVADALSRTRSTTPQAQLSADERRRNVDGAFAPTRDARRLAGATVVLVDDVSTTGTTLEACALALRTAGVADVRALTAARVVDGARLVRRSSWSEGGRL